MTSYLELKQLILSGIIKSFDDFFLHISPIQFSVDTGISDSRLRALRQLPMQMTVEEVMKISEVLDVEAGVLGNIFKDNSLVNQQ